MDATQIIHSAGGMDRTQVVSPDGADLGRTQLGGIGGGIQLSCILQSPVAPAKDISSRHALFLTTAPGKAAMGRRAPMNICLLIDRSGSMEGEPLEYVKRAACYVVDLLDQNDTLSIVVFAEDVQTVMPARRVVNKQLVKEHIMRLTVGNTTNIFDGIVMAGQQVAAANSPGVASRVLLLTDGDPTAGIKDYNSIVSKAAEFKQSGISMTALGFGLEYNEELIAGIARRCGGNYYYISRPDLIPEVFRRELDQLMTVTAQNLRLKITLSKWVRMRQVYNAAPSFSGNSVIVSLVDMERGTQMSTLAELEFGPRPTGTYRVAQAEIAYDDLGTGAPNVARCDVVLEFTNDEARLQAPDDPRVLQEIQLAEATRSLQKTMMGMRTQQLGSTDATMQLQAARTMMLQQGRHKEAAELEKTIMELQAGTGAAEKTLMGAIVSLESGKQEE